MMPGAFSSAFSSAFGGPRTTPYNRTSDPWHDDSTVQFDATKPFEEQYRTWPNSVKPSAVRVSTVSPGYETISQSGNANAVSAGYTQRTITMSYVGLNPRECQGMSRTADAAKGNALPFKLDLRLTPTIQVITQYTGSSSTNNVRFLRYPQGKTREDAIIVLGGFDANVVEALPAGSFLYGLPGFYGGICQTIYDESSNASGEVTTTLSRAPSTDPVVNSAVLVPPQWIDVRLTSGGFTYELDINNIGTATVEFVTAIYDINF